MTALFRNRTVIGSILALLAASSWGSLVVVGRFLFGNFGEECNAFVVSTFRNLIGAGVILIFVFAVKEQKNLFKALTNHFGAFAGLALVGSVLEGTLQIWSLKYTTAARCSLFANTAPIYTLLIAHFALKEPFTKRNIIGMTIGMAGAVIVAMHNGADLFGAGTMFIGDMIALLSGVCWALFTVCGVGVTKRYGGLVSCSVVMLFAGLMQLPVGLWMLRGTPPLSGSMIGSIIYMGVFTAGLANLCWMSALKYLSAGATGAFNYASFALAVLFSAIFLREKLSIPVLFAFLLVVGGVTLMVSGSGKKK